MDRVNEYLKKNSIMEDLGFTKVPRAIKRLECVDGFIISVQANEYTYCIPRRNEAWPYTEVELGFPSEKDDLILDYAEDPSEPTKTVYGYVPIELANELVEKHGGIKE